MKVIDSTGVEQGFKAEGVNRYLCTAFLVLNVFETFSLFSLHQHGLLLQAATKYDDRSRRVNATFPGVTPSQYFSQFPLKRKKKPYNLNQMNNFKALKSAF